MDRVNIDSINKNDSYRTRDISLNGTMTGMKLDTGAQDSILRDLDYQKTQNKLALEPAVVKLKGVGDHKITVNGKCSIRAKFRGKTSTETFDVVPGVQCQVFSARCSMFASWQVAG